MISFTNVSKVYPDGTRAVESFNLVVERGEFIVLIGPSGCGKTTTLKMVNRLHEPNSGTITVNGRDIMTENPVMLRRKIGYVIQQVGLFPHMTVAQNICVVPELQGWSKEARERRADELLEMVHMPPDQYRNRYPAQLSGGQQQRIGVLRALAANPDIILMDEPFGALDPITRTQLQDELKRLQEQLQKTILFVTHDIDEALKLADRIVIMRDGRILQVGTPEQILRHPADDFVTRFVGGGSALRSSVDLTAREVMSEDFVAISANKGLAEALRTMKRHHVDHLVVLDDGKYVGVISALDLHPHLSEDEATPVRQIVGSVHPPTVGPGESVQAVARLLNGRRPGFVPVLDDERRVLGIVTRSNLVDVLAESVWEDPPTESAVNQRGVTSA